MGIDKSADKKFLNKINFSIDALEKLKEQISNVIVGQKEVIEFTLIALLCEGHVLLEGVPGLGKTMLVRALSDALRLKFSRIQFTPDLMPIDIIGTNIIMQSKENNFNLEFEEGPIFANLVLADEINRASPKTQSALLEAMQERSVTVRGKKYLLPRPFQVLATQNPLEMEGTYPLPEAQIDRFFFKIIIKHPTQKELVKIVNQTVGTDEPKCEPVLKNKDLEILQKAIREVVVPDHLTEFAANFILSTQPENHKAMQKVKNYVRYGAGPRGAQTLILASKARAFIMGRYNVSLDDIMHMAIPSLRHRIALNFDGMSENIFVDDLIKEIMNEVINEKKFDTAISN